MAWQTPMRLPGLAVLAIFTCAVAALPAAQLSAAGSTAAPGSTIFVPVVLLSGGAAVSAIQFDLDWDEALAVSPLLGEAAPAAGKDLYVAPRGPHTLRCVIAGFNAGAMPDATLLRLLVSVQPQAKPQAYAVRFTNIVAADTNAQTVPFDGLSVPVPVSADSAGPLPIPSDGIVNAASLGSGAIAPGEIVSLFGPGTAMSAPPFAPQDIAVTVNGIAAPLLYVGSNQINAVVPFGLAASATATLQIAGRQQPLSAVDLSVAAAQPALFTLNATGAGAAAALNQDVTVNSPGNPAAPGSIVMFYGTGFGPTDPPAADGQAAASATSLTLPVTAYVGGNEAEILYAGSAPGLINGAVQVNVRIPAGLPPNAATAVVLQAGSVPTQAGVTVAVR